MPETGSVFSRPKNFRRRVYRLRRLKYLGIDENDAPTLGSISEVKSETIENLTEEHDKLKGILLRVQADFDNYRKRAVREKEDMSRFAVQNLLGDLLPVLDNFHRAVEAAKQTNDAQSVTHGVELILQQFDRLLSAKGVEPVPAEGKMFDPRIHEAVAVDTESKAGENRVIEVFQQGYLYKGHLLRPARVKVAKGKPSI